MFYIICPPCPPSDSLGRQGKICPPCGNSKITKNLWLLFSKCRENRFGISATKSARNGKNPRRAFDMTARPIRPRRRNCGRRPRHRSCALRLWFARGGIGFRVTSMPFTFRRKPPLDTTGHGAGFPCGCKGKNWNWPKFATGMCRNTSRGD